MIVLMLIALTYYRLPWRQLPDAGPRTDAPAADRVDRQYRRRSRQARRLR